MSAPTVEEKIETPFTSGALKSGSSVPFWKSYIESRPVPTEDFFQLITDYHKSHGDTRTCIAHDVGTGPGNIAARLTSYFDLVVGSDVNENALAVAPVLAPPRLIDRMRFVVSPAENLAEKTPPEFGGQGTTDLITVSECMPLLDAPNALKAFHGILRDGGTLGIYFYGRCIFTGVNADKCNAIYEKIATRICSFNQPIKDTPAFPFYFRAAETLLSYLDNIAIPSEDWESVERHKWNCDYPLIFNSKEGLDFDCHPVDCRAESEFTREATDQHFWAAEWSAENVNAYLDSVYPNYRDKAGARYEEIEAMLQDLREAMGGGKKEVTFPVVLILATKKAPSPTGLDETSK